MCRLCMFWRHLYLTLLALASVFLQAQLLSYVCNYYAAEKILF